MPAKVRRGRIKNRKTGKSTTAKYYPRKDGGYVAQSGPYKGKRVAKRSLSRDRRRRSGSGPTPKGYGHKTDKSGKRRKKDRGLAASPLIFVGIIGCGT